MTPAISVIMPVHNGAEWLAEAIASVRAQDFGDFEFLIVDDGSDDGTAAMLSRFAADDGRIRLLHQAPQGIVAALNNAIAAARAPYLARLDADDRARPYRLGKQFAFMEAHPEIGLLGTFAERIDAAGNIVGRLVPATDHAGLARVLGRTNPFIHSSVMMRPRWCAGSADTAPHSERRKTTICGCAWRRPAASPTSRTISPSTAGMTPTCRGATRYGNRSRCG
jgi:glycosyltransferase involved in cell wall biosynthesis